MRMRAMGVVMLLLAGGCDDDTSGAVDMTMAPSDMAVPDLSTGATASRGEELVKHLLFCGNCHTTPDASGNPSTNPADFLAGGKMFTVNVGGDGGTATVYASNLTPDNATGIGMWTTSQLSDSVVYGIDNQGTALWPTMPYQRFASLTLEDSTSIALYLQSLPAQSHAVPADSVRATLAGSAFDFTAIPHTTLAATDPSFASAERGRYLGILGCLQCHTPAGAGPGNLDPTKSFAGGRTFGGGVKSQNLTPDATGLAGWTVNDIVQTLQTDLEKGVGVMLAAPMPGGLNGLGGLSDPDLSDLAAYIHTLPPVVNGPFGHPDM